MTKEQKNLLQEKINTQRIQPWTEQEIKDLREAVKMGAQASAVHKAELFPGRSLNSIRFKMTSLNISPNKDES